MIDNSNPRFSTATTTSLDGKVAEMDAAVADLVNVSLPETTPLVGTASTTTLPTGSAVTESEPESEPVTTTLVPTSIAEPTVDVTLSATTPPSGAVNRFSLLRDALANNRFTAFFFNDIISPPETPAQTTNAAAPPSVVVLEQTASSFVNASAPAPVPTTTAKPTSNVGNMYFGTTSFVNEVRMEERDVESRTVISQLGFRDALYFFGAHLLGSRFPEDAQKSDYSLGVFLSFLKISILVILNFTLNATVWTAIIESIENNKFPGNTRVPQNFLVANIANEQLSFLSTLFYDNPTGTREGLPPASAALLGLLIATGVLRLAVSAAYYGLNRKHTSSIDSVTHVQEDTGETTALLSTPPTTKAQPHPFVTLVNRYSEVNTWSRFTPLIIFNTLGTLINFAIINGVALSRVTYPDIPDKQATETDNPLEDPQSYMLLLTQVSLASTILFGLIFGMIKARGLSRTEDAHYVTNVMGVEGENPLYQAPPLGAQPDTIAPPPEHDDKRYCCC